jgi:asparagine synthase (glutamine-hydrolysing)
MISEDGQVVLSYNGEIYNYRELKDELRRAGCGFRTNSDTEVIIQAYRQWGIRFLERLNGMYALALLDKNRQTLWLARDPAGIKPLYHAQLGNGFYFASELRAFRVLGAVESHPDWKPYFMLFGHLPEPITPFKHVVPLKKGSVLEYDLRSDEWKVTDIVRPRFARSSITNEKQAVESIRAILQESVKRHLISDAPIGLFLSGGIDSSLITLIANALTPESLKTLSIYFDDERYSEKAFQDLIIAITHNQHTSYCVRYDEFAGKVNDILSAMDSPSVDGVNTYFISQFAAASGLKAVLSGLGADELLGGYRSFDRARYAALLSRLSPQLLQHFARNHSGRIGRLGFLSIKHPAAEYLFYRGIFSLKDVARHCGVDHDYLIDLISSLPYPEEFDTLQGAERAGFLEYHYYMGHQLLRDTDYMSMWHGLEVRVPFLDREFVSLCNAIAPELKYGRGRGKYLLIKAFEDVLPEKIWKRRKSGFAFPFKDWFRAIDLFKDFKFPANVVEDGLRVGNLPWSQQWLIYLMEQWEPGGSMASN